MRQKHSTAIPNYLWISPTQWKPVLFKWAVQLEPHFLSIFRLGQEFAIIDGCQHYVIFPTFVAAVARCYNTLWEKQLSCVDRGVHILLYHKDVALWSSYGVQAIPGMPQPSISSTGCNPKLKHISGPLFTKKTPSYQYRDSHYNSETVVRGPSQ